MRRVNAAPEAAAGLGARTAVRAAADAVCRPAPVQRRARPWSIGPEWLPMGEQPPQAFGPP